MLNQLKAVQAALDKTAEIMLRDHLNTCVVEAVQHNDSQRVMEELWQLLRRPYAEEEDQLSSSGIVSSAGIAATTTGAGGCCSNNKPKTKTT